MQVYRAGDLDILFTAFDKVHGMPVAFHNSRIICERRSIARSLVSLFQDIQLKALWSLYRNKVIPVHGDSPVTAPEFADTVGQGNDRDCTTVLLGAFKTAHNKLLPGEGPDAVMDAYDALRLMNRIEPIADGPEPGFSTRDDPVSTAELEFITHRLPEFDMVFREDEDDLDLGEDVHECINGMHQNRLSTQGNELLGDVGMEAFTTSTRCDNQVFL